jgi:hypothetical protein
VFKNDFHLYRSFLEWVSVFFFRAATTMTAARDAGAGAALYQSHHFAPSSSLTAQNKVRVRAYHHMGNQEPFYVLQPDRNDVRHHWLAVVLIVVLFIRCILPFPR